MFRGRSILGPLCPGSPSATVGHETRDVCRHLVPEALSRREQEQGKPKSPYERALRVPDRHVRNTTIQTSLICSRSCVGVKDEVCSDMTYLASKEGLFIENFGAKKGPLLSSAVLTKSGGFKVKETDGLGGNTVFMSLIIVTYFFST